MFDPFENLANKKQPILLNLLGSHWSKKERKPIQLPSKRERLGIFFPSFY